jgi:hypothetical protein
MKQIAKTPQILARLQKAAGDGVSTDDLAVFEAIAFNTLPLRKSGALYNKAVAESGVLLSMAEEINRESLPVQINHDSTPLPIGRVFLAEVQNTGSGAELRVLFFVGKEEQKHIQKIDNGVVDQVSVSILPKQIVCSECGFDFLGPKAEFDHIYSGIDDKGHQMGKDGVHARLVGLDKFFEMSLVGRGGAQNARIVAGDNATLTRLAAGGHDPNKMILSATARTSLMDMEALIAQLTDAKAAKAVTEAENVALKAAATASTAKITSLEAQVAALPDVAAKDTEITSLKAELTAAVVALKDFAGKILVASGDLVTKPTEKVAELTALIAEKAPKVSLILAAGGKGQEASAPTIVDAPRTQSLNAFRT